MTERKGILPNQPLFYVLASMRFQPWMLLPSKIPEIQNTLRDRLPLVNQLVFEHFIPPAQIDEADPASSQIPIFKRHAWSFMRADRSVGCQISADQIVMHALKYTEFEVFAEETRFVLDAVQAHSRHLDMNAMGIRYLDRIAPLEGEGIAEYFEPGFLPMPLDSGGLQAIGGFTQTVYNTHSGILQARFWSGTGYLEVPEDLVPLYLLTQDLAKGQSSIKQLESNVGMLDSDSIWTSSEPIKMNTDEAVVKLRELHTHANGFFRSACSKHAFDVWGRK